MRTPLIILLAFAAGGAGILGGQFASRHLFASNSEAPASHPLGAAQVLLNPGEAFPNAEVVDESGRTRKTVELLAQGTTAVLFIDPDCPPCGDTTTRWQTMIDEGKIDSDDVFGITFRPLEDAEEYRRENNLDFAIYQDPEGTFIKEYEVSRFPLEITVDAMGTIQEIGRDLTFPEQR